MISQLKFVIETKQRINLVKGQFPAKLLKVWDEHHNSIGSENDNPRFFSDEQLFVIFQTRNNGISLEDFTFTNPSQAKSILIQVIAKYFMVSFFFE